MTDPTETSAGEAGSPDPLSNERLAEIRAEFGPKSVYSSGAAGDGVCVMGNELLDEIDRLNLVLDANRVVRNAAESSNRVHKAVVDRLKTERTRLRAELDKCAGLNRELVNEAVDATTRAETAERELAEMRERIGGDRWRVRYQLGPLTEWTEPTRHETSARDWLEAFHEHYPDQPTSLWHGYETQWREAPDV